MRQAQIFRSMCFILWAAAESTAYAQSHRLAAGYQPPCIAQAQSPSMEWQLLTPVDDVFIEPIHFSPSKDHALNPLNEERLAFIALLMEEFPDFYVTLTGTTERLGSWSANCPLAIKRAEFAATQLVTLGVAPNRIFLMAEPEVGDGAEARSTQVTFSKRTP